MERAASRPEEQLLLVRRRLDPDPRRFDDADSPRPLPRGGYVLEGFNDVLGLLHDDSYPHWRGPRYPQPD